MSGREQREAGEREQRTHDRAASCPDCGEEVGVLVRVCPGCGLEAPVLELLAASGRVPGGGSAHVFAVWPGRWTIGRSRACDIVLRDSSISRIHAQLVHHDHEPGRVEIVDEGGANGVYLGPERVRRAPLESGSVLQLGRLALRFVQPISDAITTERLTSPLQHLSLPGSDVARQAALLALDQLQLGVLLMDGEARALVVNRSARAILDGGDAVSLQGSTLRCRSSADQARLRELLAPEGPRAGALLVSRPAGRPIAVLVHRLDTPVAGGLTGLRAVFLSDPELGIEPAGDVLARLYHLTPAEARLAGELLQGRTLEESAEQLGVTVHTARTHLRRVFEKTDTRRQSELVLLLLRGTAQVRPPAP